MNEEFGKDFYRKGNSVKRCGLFSEPPDSEKLKSCCSHPLPENQLLLLVEELCARRPPKFLEKRSENAWGK